MTTQFVHTALNFPGGTFHLDGNGKVTNALGSFDKPKPNAFSLPHVVCCPGSTPTCRAACYVNGLEGKQGKLYELYKLNAVALQRALLTRVGFQQSAWYLGKWIAANCAGGMFRWHVSGDVMSIRHARWIVEVCSWATVPCWIYTRTLEAVPTLVQATTLVVNVSADGDNLERATETARRHGVRLCYMSSGGELPMYMRDGDVIFPDYELRGDSRWWTSLTQAQRRSICPADYFGQSEHHRCGPCRKCMERV